VSPVACTPAPRDDLADNAADLDGRAKGRSGSPGASARRSNICAVDRDALLACCTGLVAALDVLHLGTWELAVADTPVWYAVLARRAGPNPLAFAALPR